MQSNHAEHFFETDASQALRESRARKACNKHGNPRELNSKILAAIAVPNSLQQSVFVAESSGCTSGVEKTYRGPQAPVTSLTLSYQSGNTIFAGSWDKDIWSWDVDTAQQVRKFSRHTDFVKTLACAVLSGKEILISGGADRQILIWNVELGHHMHTLQDAATGMLALQSIIVDPVLSNEEAVVIFTAGSDTHVRRWRIGADGGEQLAVCSCDETSEGDLTMREHDTSIYKLVFDQDEGDLWTASADGTAKCFARSHGFICVDVFRHDSHVRAVAVTEHWVATAGRDEDIKIWDRASGNLFCTLKGHFDEVTDLVILPSTQGRKAQLCSVSIDRTIRTWPLDRTQLQEVIETIENSNNADQLGSEREASALLTAEEEAELAAMMNE